MDPVRTSIYNWSDGKTISCYTWTNYNDIKWYKINIQEAQSIYPKMSRIQAIKQVAKDRFENNCPSDK